MILGLGALYFFLIFFNIAGEFLVNIAGFIIPGYYSLAALFSASKVDDTQVSKIPWSPRQLSLFPYLFYANSIAVVDGMSLFEFLENPSWEAPHARD